LPARYGGRGRSCRNLRGFALKAAGIAAMKSSLRLVDPAQLRSRRIGDLDRYWRQLCAGRKMPSRSAIDPGEIQPLLSNLDLTDISYDPFRVHYRLVGTALVHAVGFGLAWRIVGVRRAQGDALAATTGVPPSVFDADASAKESLRERRQTVS